MVTKGTDEPYRMFTSRVEYRLLLREDNADLRLSKIGYDVGLVSKEQYKNTIRKQESIQNGLKYLKENRIPDNGKKITLYQLLKRPQVRIGDLREKLTFKTSADALKVLETEVKYAGFIKRQITEVRGFKNLEKIRIPQDLDYSRIPSLSREIREKLLRF